MLGSGVVLAFPAVVSMVCSHSHVSKLNTFRRSEFHDALISLPQLTARGMRAIKRPHS